MSEYITKEDLEESMRPMRAALETAIVQTSVAMSFAATALLESKDMGWTIELLEASLNTGLDGLHFSQATDAQIQEYRQAHAAQIECLKATYKKVQQKP